MADNGRAQWHHLIPSKQFSPFNGIATAYTHLSLPSMITRPMQLYPSLPLWNDEVLNQAATTIRCCHRARASQQRCVSRCSLIPATTIKSATKVFDSRNAGPRDHRHKLLNVLC